MNKETMREQYLAAVISGSMLAALYQNGQKIESKVVAAGAIDLAREIIRQTQAQAATDEVPPEYPRRVVGD
jgi:hypothetical protein